MEKQLFLVFMTLPGILFSCGKKKSDEKKEPPNFQAQSNVLMTSSTLATSSLNLLEDPPEVKCMEMTSCFNPSNITGKALAAGLGISANGQLETYLFGGDKYSGLSPDAGSQLFDFNFKTPLKIESSLVCCNGSSSFESAGYFQTAKFLFAYLDVTFDFSAPNNTILNGTHTYRFVTANDQSRGYKRGDILYLDPSDNTFKWASSGGALSASRPVNPATQDAAVVNWTNPDGKGNLEIPIIEGGFVGTEKVTVSRSDLENFVSTFTFDFNTKNAIVINSELSSLNLFSNQYDLMNALVLRGLPHSKLQLGGNTFVSRLTYSKKEK